MVVIVMFMQDDAIVKQIFNMRIRCEKMTTHKREVNHNFIDFKKAFDGVWQKALLKMRKNNIDMSESP